MLREIDASSFSTSDSISFVDDTGSDTGSFTPESTKDWYDQQTLGLTNSTIFWKSIAPKPISNNYVTERNGKNDGMHVVVVDDLGTVTGIKGNILEKHVGLSKAEDTVSSVNSPQRIYYKQYLADFSANIYAGVNPSQTSDAYHGTTPVATSFASDFTPVSTADGLWGSVAQDTTYQCNWKYIYTHFMGGSDYSASGGMKAELSDIVTSYSLFSNRDEIEVDYIIMGPGCENEFDSQAKANYIISLSEWKKGLCICSRSA